jgi:hypothetical protein
MNHAIIRIHGIFERSCGISNKTETVLMSQRAHSAASIITEQGLATVTIHLDIQGIRGIVKEF